jgi:N-acetylglutamate synthase-like GNAT family acetyltransferase
MFAVEKAKERDAESICTLDKDISGSASKRAFIEAAIKAGQCYICKEYSKLVGFAVLNQSFFGQYFIALLVVHRNHQGQGVGAALLDQIEVDCPAEKLFTSAKSSDSLNLFWRTHGFEQSGQIKHLNDGEPEIIYFKRLWKKGQP